MKIYFNILFALTLLLFISSCNSNKTKFIKNEKLPKFVKNDTLINTHIVKIIDINENRPQIIHFINPTDTIFKIEKQYYSGSGKIYIEGELKNEKREGKWLAWYENGILWSMGYYKDGKKEGPNEAYYTNGNLRYSKFYKNDKSEGLAKFFNPHGELIAEIEFKNDSIINRIDYK